MPDNEPLPVLVTGIGGGGHGEQIVKALRLANRYRIIGTDITDQCAGRALVDVFHRVPRAGDPLFIDTVIALARKHRVRAVFHGSEPEMSVLSSARLRFAEADIYLPVNLPEVLAICLDKAKTQTFLRQCGLPTPRSVMVSSIEDLEGFDSLPAVLKPSIGGGGSANVFIAQTLAELRAFASYLLSIYPRFLVQEYIGTPDEEYTVGVLFGEDGALLNSIAIKRVINTALSVRIRAPNRSQRSELGKHLVISSGISQGIVGRWPNVTRQCEVIAAALKPTAPINIQCRLVDNQVLPFEINPRFSGTTSIRALAGFNEPDVLIRRHVLGEHIQKYFAYQEVLVMRGLMEQVVDVHAYG